MSPQAQALYQILLTATIPLSARQLGARLHIVSNTVYRLIEELIQIGLIVKTGRRPYLFSAKPVDDGLSLFLLSQHDWFTKQFALLTKNKEDNGRIPPSQEVSLSFIQSRDELMNLSIGEVDRANKSVDLLRSGGEIPADLILSMIQAKERGVITRMLIQDYSSENVDQVINWKKNGILVRKTSLRHIRLMLYDSIVVYFMSYRHSDSEKDMGMKINYPPFATILSQLFNQWWKAAEII